MMKKIFIVLLIISVIATFFVLPAGAETSSRGVSNAYDIMVDFVTENPARVSGSKGAEKSAEYIKNYFDKFVDSASTPEIVVASSTVAPQKIYETKVQEFTYEVYTQGKGFFSYPTIEKINDRNVVATKKSKNQNAKTVIIGAHYDNKQEDGQGSGAYDNGSGVGIMLSLADRLKDVELDFNLVFVAFGAHEYYYEGSAQFVKEMSLSEKLNVSLYINLDSIAGGDNLYIYADEVNTIQEDYFIKHAKNTVALNRAPVNKGTYIHEYSKLGYAHAGLDSDNLPFFNEGILTVSFSSHNWTILSSNVLDESADANKPNIIGTKDDNINTLLRLYGDKVKTRMVGVENLIYSAITDSSFVTEMQRAKRENGDYSLILNKYFIPLITLGFLIIVAVLTVLINKKYKGKKPSQPKNDGGEDGRGENGPKVFADFD